MVVFPDQDITHVAVVFRELEFGKAHGLCFADTDTRGATTDRIQSGFLVPVQTLTMLREAVVSIKIIASLVARHA
jgi:hypothetical protein